MLHRSVLIRDNDMIIYYFKRKRPAAKLDNPMLPEFAWKVCIPKH